MATREVEERLEQHRHQIQHQIERAERLEAEANEIKANVAAQKRRIDSGPPEADACPDCWVKRGKVVIITAQTAADPDRFDRWGCSKCGFSFDVRTGL